MPITQKNNAVTRAEDMTVPATVANMVSTEAVERAAIMDAAVTERMATGVSWGRLIMVAEGENIPVKRHRAADPKIHIPAALDAKSVRGPEKMILAKETSTMTRMAPMIIPWIRAGMNLGEKISVINSRMCPAVWLGMAGGFSFNFQVDPRV